MRSTLDHLPPMDDMKIGPAGQTFGELKQAVLDARAAMFAALAQGIVPEATTEAYGAAVDVLKTAYKRVGLKYVAP